SIGAARDTYVTARPERDAVGAVHAFAAQPVRRFGDDVGIARVVLGYGERSLLACRKDAFDARSRVAFEDRSIFGNCRGARGIANGIEVRIACTPADRIDLFARQLEGNTDFDEGLGAAHAGHDALLESLGNLLRPSSRNGRRFPAERPAKIDESASRQQQLERTFRFRIDFFPRRCRDRRVLAQEAVHTGSCARRLPIPRLPSSLAAAASPSLPPCSASSSIARTDFDVNEYVRKCSSSIGSWRRSHSSVIAACSFSSSRLCRRISLSSSSCVASRRWSYQSTASSSSMSETIARCLSIVSGL